MSQASEETRIEVPQRWDRQTTETFAVCPFCRRQCLDDYPETCCQHHKGLVIDTETGRGFVAFVGVLSCPCSPDQPVRPGFRYCWNCLSIASTDAHYREDDYRDRRAA